MGFKEVMALRQENKLEEALSLAREDYKDNRDQWSASALFHVLNDLADEVIVAGEQSKALPYIKEMEAVVGDIGATRGVAMEALEQLQKKTIPHYSELASLATEIEKTSRRDRVREIFVTVTDWHKTEEGGIHPVLHEYFATIILTYIELQLNYLEYDVYQELSELYLSLENKRPSKQHSRFLELALKAKKNFEQKMNLNELLNRWDLVNLTPEDWKRSSSYGHDNRSLAEKTLDTILSEFLDFGADSKEVPAPVYKLLLDALSFYPDDELVLLTQARMNMIEGQKELALEQYKKLLITLSEPRAWMEFASLIDDPEIQMGALCMALRKEDDEYQNYLLVARLKLAELLINKGMYENALRELNIVAQISLEKGLEMTSEYQELLKRIPEGTIADRENKDFYYPNSRPAQEYIYESLPEKKMLVIDVIAIRFKDGKQVLPMLKLIDSEGTTVLVSPKESGVIKGNNRGLCYNVKMVKRPRRFTKVVLMTLCEDQSPEDLFPVVVGCINGYSQTQFAHHVIDTKNRHHYLPGNEKDYVFGEFIEFLHVIEYPVQKKGAKGGSTQNPREYLLSPKRLDPQEGLRNFPPQRAEVQRVRESDYILITEEGIRSFVNKSISPIELYEGDTVIVRGFQQRHKDRRTGEINYSYITLSVEVPEE